MPLIRRIPIQTTYESSLRVILPNVEDFSYTFVIVVVVVGVSSAVPIRITKGGYLLAHGAEHKVRNACTKTTLSNDLLGRRGRSVLRPRGRTVRHWPFCPPAIRCLHNAQPVIYCLAHCSGFHVPISSLQRRRSRRQRYSYGLKGC